MFSMLVVPIILTLAPTAAYQIVMLLAGRKSAPAHYVWTYIMMAYIWLVFFITGIGSVSDMLSRGGFAATLRQANVNLTPFSSEGPVTYCLNVLMFMPLGFLLPYIWKDYRHPLKVSLTGLLFSSFIEFAQLPTNRIADIDDLTMNTLGAVLGYIVWKIIGAHFFGGREPQRTAPLGKYEPEICLALTCVCNFCC